MGKKENLKEELEQFESEQDLNESGSEVSITLTKTAYLPELNRERKHYDILVVEFNPEYPELTKVTREHSPFDSMPTVLREINRRLAETYSREYKG